jgi:hypothetical protein
LRNQSKRILEGTSIVVRCFVVFAYFYNFNFTSLHISQLYCFFCDGWLVMTLFLKMSFSCPLTISQLILSSRELQKLYAQVCEEQALSFHSKKVHTPTIEKAITIYTTNKDLQHAKGKKLLLTTLKFISHSLFTFCFLISLISLFKSIVYVCFIYNCSVWNALELIVKLHQSGKKVDKSVWQSCFDIVMRFAFIGFFHSIPNNPLSISSQRLVSDEWLGFEMKRKIWILLLTTATILSQFDLKHAHSWTISSCWN